MTSEETPLYHRVKAHPTARIAPSAGIVGDVTIGRDASVFELGENVLVGMGSIVMNRAKIGANSLIGAGSLVTEGKEFPPGSLIMGTPARVKRALTDEEIASMCTFPADDYVRQSGEMLEQGVLEHPAPDMDMHRGA